MVHTPKMERGVVTVLQYAKDVSARGAGVRGVPRTSKESLFWDRDRLQYSPLVHRGLCGVLELFVVAIISCRALHVGQKFLP